MTQPMRCKASALAVLLLAATDASTDVRDRAADFQAALDQRLALDRRSGEAKAAPPQSPLVRAFAQWRQGQSPLGLHPHQRVRAFCVYVAQGACSWEDAYELLDLEDRETPLLLDPSAQRQLWRQWWGDETPTDRLAQSMPAPGAGQECARIPAGPGSAVEFLDHFVAASQPVIVTGAVENWTSLARWDLAYLEARAGPSSVVKAYASADGDFEKVQRLGDWERMCRRVGAELTMHLPGDAALALDELLLVRPAETELPLRDFVALLRDEPRTRRGTVAADLTFYLQKHKLDAWRATGLLDDVAPPFHWSASGRRGRAWSRFLRPLHYLLWLGRGWSRGPIHFDEQENLHTMVRGSKTFELFHPLSGADLYESQAHFHTAHLLFAFDESRGRQLWRLPLTLTPPGYQPFSPVNVSNPDLGAHPRFANAAARRLTCTVRAGETLFVPAYWWHEVTTQGDPSVDHGLAVGVNTFFRPWYLRVPRAEGRWNAQAQGQVDWDFYLNPYYRHLWPDQDPAFWREKDTAGRPFPPGLDPNYWNLRRPRSPGVEVGAAGPEELKKRAQDP